MNAKNSKTKTIILSLLAVVAGMAVGYAALSQQLTINGTAQVSGTWNVSIKSVTAGTMTDAVAGTPTVNGTTASFTTDLKKPGANGTYTVVVQNAGTIPATLDSITGLTEANSAQPVDVKYTVSGINEGDSLGAGKTATFTVKVEWVSSATSIPATTSKTLTLGLNYVQA